MNGMSITVTLANDGAATFYWDWPINLYLEDCNGNTLQTLPLSCSLPDLLPGRKASVKALLKNPVFGSIINVGVGRKLQAPFLQKKVEHMIQILYNKSTPTQSKGRSYVLRR